MRIPHPLSPRQKTACAAFCIVVIALPPWMDFLKGAELTISLLYLVPVGLATWFIGRRTGVGLALLCAGLWLAADIIRPATLRPGESCRDAGTEPGFTLAFALALAALRDTPDREKALARLDPLTGVADTLRSPLRASDLVARLGGDEFALLLPETSLSSAREPLDKLHRALSDTMREHQWPVTFSIGAVSFPTPPGSVDQRIHKADDRMYTVKNGGKNRLTQSEDGR